MKGAEGMDVDDDSIQTDIDNSGPLTEAQKITLDTLAAQTGSPVTNEALTADQADAKIEELQAEAGLSAGNLDVEISNGGLSKTSADDDYDNRADMSTGDDDV